METKKIGDLGKEKKGLSSRLANEVVRRPLNNYLKQIIKGYDQQHATRFVRFTPKRVTIFPFEVVQTSLIALMGGSSPIANVHVGKCTMSLPSTIALPTNQQPVHVHIKSLECDMLAFPNVLPREQVLVVMRHLLGKAADAAEAAKLGREIGAVRRRKRDGAKREAAEGSLPHKVLLFLDGYAMLFFMLLLVCTCFVVVLQQLNQNAPERSSGDDCAARATAHKCGGDDTCTWTKSDEEGGGEAATPAPKHGVGGYVEELGAKRRSDFVPRKCKLERDRVSKVSRIHALSPHASSARDERRSCL